MATLRINFTPASPAPANGYVVRYRPVGTTVYTTLSPNPTSSPVTIDVAENLEYEGYITASCAGGVESSQEHWTTSNCRPPSEIVAVYKVTAPTPEINLAMISNMAFYDGTMEITWKYYTKNNKLLEEQVVIEHTETHGDSPAAVLTPVTIPQGTTELLVTSYYGRPGAGQPTVRVYREITAIQYGKAQLGDTLQAYADVSASA
jgi:hypothetical protein